MRISWLAAPALVVALAVTACGGGSTVPPTGTPPTGTGSSTSGSVASVGTATADRSAPTAAQRAVPLTDGRLTVRVAPSADAAVLTRLEPATPLGSPLVLLVEQQRSGWVRVALPTRPNGSSGWLPAEQVRLEPVDDRIEVDLDARTLHLVLDGVEVADTAVAVGTADNPTPAGAFFVTDRVEPTDPDGAYGSFALGLSAHSDTLSEFGGGDGQIGIHGTNDAGSIGRRASHGCIRVPDELADLLAAVPLGTPVLIG